MTELPGPVLIVGTGLIGTSIGMALRRVGVTCELADRDPSALATAIKRGAGLARSASEPSLIVVAVPPVATPPVVLRMLEDYPDAIVTDVASIKAPIEECVVDSGVSIGRYVGGHPMAGREVSGPAAARADLLEDRPWVIAAPETALPRAIVVVEELVRAVRALPFRMTAVEHDRAVALVSHAPQVIASLLAAQLLEATETSVSIAGQGLRDMTRIAASDAGLWAEILHANALPVSRVLASFRADLDVVIDELTASGGPEHMSLVRVLMRGQAGRERLPGKHGATGQPTVEIPVVVPDGPGELGRLLAVFADADVSIEDLRIEHMLGRPTGVAVVTVAEQAGVDLVSALRARGWEVRA